MANKGTKARKPGIKREKARIVSEIAKGTQALFGLQQCVLRHVEIRKAHYRNAIYAMARLMLRINKI